MSLSSISIRRPVLAIVMSIVLVIFGIVSFRYLGVREFPAVDPAIITVSTSYAGANAEVIESQITTPLEESINSVAGIRNLTSISRDGRSTITAEFELGVDLESAANDVRDRVSRAIHDLPPDTDPPQVSKADADSSPVVSITVKSSLRSLLELSELADKIFKARLETIPGVSEVDIWGDKEYAMRLRMDPQRLAAYNLTPIDVRNALRESNVELPSGTIEGDLIELTVRTLSRMAKPEEFDTMIIKRSGDAIVRFRDIGYAELGAQNEKTILKRDGIPMVGVVLRPQPGANHIAMVDEFYRRLAQIKKELPPDIEIGISHDTTRYIRDSIKEVGQTIFVALALVVLIIFLFLREWRSTLIPVVVIPISLISAFFIMYVAGFSINILTLLALVLAIGLVVDDAIVVLENIYSKIEQGMAPIEAGLTGTREIFLAVVATTIVLAAVFLPLLFLGGLSGRLFREFGTVLAGAVIVSAFVALTLTPMLSTRMLKKHAHTNWFYRATEPFFAALTNGYKRALAAFLNVRWLAFPILAACVAAAWYFTQILPKELAPLEDRSSLRINATAPEGVSYDAMLGYTDELNTIVQRAVPERASMITMTAPGGGNVNSGFLRITLLPPGERKRSQQQIADDLTARLKQFSDVRAYVSQEPTIGSRRSGLPIQFVLQSGNLEDLEEVLPKFLDAAQQDPTFSFVDVDLKFNKPELQIHIDRDRARILGVSVLDVAQTLQASLSGQRFGYFLMNGKQYEVIGQLDREFRRQTMDLRQITVRSAGGENIPLDNLVRISESSTPPSLYRFNRYSSATIVANLAKGKTIGDGIAAMDAIARKQLDDRFTTDLAGQSRDFVESSSSLVFVFLFALLLVYLVLAAQFESFRDPFTIMLTVPLALGGAFLALWLFGESLNIFSEIGLTMLIGLVTKNGILIVEFANQRKAAGLKLHDAIQDAALARFRPILMTSLSTILGILPIALALGAGSESRVSMGIAIIGGMLAGTALTLFVIPAIYSYLSREITAEEAARLRADDELMTADR